MNPLCSLCLCGLIMFFYKNSFQKIIIFFFLFFLPLVGIVAAEEMPELPNTCAECHQSSDDERLKKPAADWDLSVHKKAGVSCKDCHGGDPSSYDEAMEVKAGFTGKPKKEDIPALCAKCHADSKKMRVYNLRTDQYSYYQESIHGKRLAGEKDKKVPTCVDCHGTHAVFSKKDPRSPVHRPNIIKTCSKCHSDKAYMAEYKVPTDQYDGYLQSYHGKLLIEKEDPRVPTCADCHSGHGAAPPGAKDVSEVCGNCHSVTAEFFSKSKHSLAMEETGKPRCVNCHGKHNIPFPGVEKFTGDGPNDCRSCHPPDSPAFKEGVRLKGMLETADSSVRKARDAVAELKKKGGTGFEISNLGDKLDDANTKLVKTVAMTHTMHIPLLEKRIGEITGAAKKAHEEIEAIFKELKIRNIGLIFTWVFLLLFIWALNEKRKSIRKEALRRKRTEGSRGRRAEDRGQKTEDRRHRAEDRQ